MSSSEYSDNGAPITRDPSIEKFIQTTIERETKKEHLANLKSRLSPKKVREYDEVYHGDTEKKDTYRLIFFLVGLVISSPVIIYLMYLFTQDFSCVENSTSSASSSYEYIGDCPIVFVIMNIVLMFVLFVTVGVVAGVIAVKTGINVGYTRKILHFASFFFPFIVNEIIYIHSHFSVTILKFWLILVVFFLASKPIRRRFYPSGLIFRAIDRPEDKGYTLKWMVTQFIASGLVILPFNYLWDYWQENDSGLPTNFTDQLMLILVLIGGVGDGLAEPVGIKFGKYKLCGHALTYRTRAIWYHGRPCNGSFTRSYPGSSMVWLVSIISIGVLHEPFSGGQLLLALIFMPIIMTLTEALSPRTWDSPFLFGIGALTLTALVKIPIGDL